MRSAPIWARPLARRRGGERVGINDAGGRSPSASPLVIALAAALMLTGISVEAPAASSSGLISQVGLDIDGEAAGDESGSAVSMSSDGTRVAIGATLNGGAGTSAGHVRVYGWNGSAWVQLGTDIDGDAASDYAGYSVSLSGDGSTVAVGSWIANSLKGEARVFSWDGSDWNQLGNDLVGETSQDFFGTSVALSSDGSRVAIGATGDDDNGSNSGHVRVYDWDGSAWSQVGSDLDGEAAGDQSGASVSLSSDGSRLAIGAEQNDGAGAASGHVRVYEWGGAAWSRLGADIDGEAPGDQSGASVTLSSDGSRIAIGAWGNDGNGSASGHVRVYDWDGSAWTQAGDDIDGEAGNDQLGRSVSLSSDGSRLAVGARANDGNGIGSGHARLFDWDGSSWVQLGGDIDGEAAGDESGWAVSLASDGSRLAIGAPKNDGTGTSAGHVRVYGLPAIERGEDSSASQSAPSRPGIYLAVHGRVGRPVDGSVVGFGAALIAPGSPTSLTVEGMDGTRFPRRLLSRVTADAWGNLESEVTLSALAAGSYRIVLTGSNAAGDRLMLTNHVSVDESGQFRTVSSEDVQPFLR